MQVQIVRSEVEVKIIRFESHGPVLSFQIGGRSVGALVHDARMEPPWCADVGYTVNGWKNPAHRFASEDDGVAFMLTSLGAATR